MAPGKKETIFRTAMGLIAIGVVLFMLLAAVAEPEGLTKAGMVVAACLLLLVSVMLADW